MCRWPHKPTESIHVVEKDREIEAADGVTVPTVTKSKLSLLQLVYPPISNQEAVWLQSDPEVIEQFRQSDFYMIGGRAEAKFTEFEVGEEGHVLRFNVRVGNCVPDPVRIRILELPSMASRGAARYWLEAGEKGIRIWDGPDHEQGSDVLEWFTTEKLLMDRSRSMPGIEGLDRYRDLSTFDLLYVGIAKTGDSFDRLIANGHKARMEILANEPQRYPGARVTDEIYLFLFRVEPLVFQTFEPEHDFAAEDFSGAVEPKRIVADAEKAFVSLLKPQYNIVRFTNYPHGTDGLYQSEYSRYGYTIAEQLSFNTAHGRIKGARHPSGFVSNDADCILVDGDNVSLLVSSVDFPLSTA